jgi:pyrroloquinoline-quinone synthase
MEYQQRGDMSGFETSRTARVTARAQEVLEQSGIRRNPYLQTLEDGTMPLEGFRRSQEQFFFAVTFFPRPMAALVGRIPDPKCRLDILHNLVEEHGEFDERLFTIQPSRVFCGVSAASLKRSKRNRCLRHCVRLTVY